MTENIYNQFFQTVFTTVLFDKKKSRRTSKQAFSLIASESLRALR